MRRLFKDPKVHSAKHMVAGVLLIALPFFGGWASRTPGDCRPDDSSSAAYVWTQLTPQADFPKSYNFQLFADDRTIHAFHSQGVWSSTDGRTWRRTALTNIIGGQAFLGYVKFREAVYALGTFHGNIERFTQTSQIARTSDYKHWEILAEQSSLPRRYFYHPFVFGGKIWIIGGEDASGKHDDAWSSSDGVHWTKVAETLPFGKRAGQHFVTFRNKLYMLDFDAWVSSDGIRWNLLTAKIADGNIFGYSVEVYDDAIWLIGCNRSGTFKSEVLTSSDGITWKTEHAPWTPRGGVATALFQNELIMTGGKYGGPGIAGQTEFVYSNDVWSFRKR